MSEHAHESYEPGGVHTGYVLLLAFGFMALLGIAIGALYAAYSLTGTASQRPPPRKVFPAPRLEAKPAAELHRLLARQHAAMSSYRWANAEHTLVTIPIDRAMALIAHRGARAFDPIPGESGSAEASPQGGSPAPALPSPPETSHTGATPPAQPQPRKTAPTPPAESPGLGSGTQSGAKQ